MEPTAMLTHARRPTGRTPLAFDRQCPLCRLPLNELPPPQGHTHTPWGITQVPATCHAAHQRAISLHRLLLMQHQIVGPQSAVDYVRALQAAPLQQLLDVLRVCTDWMPTGTAPEWLDRLLHDPREVPDPTLCPCAQVWEVLLDQLGVRALQAVAVPIVRAAVQGDAHVAWPWGSPFIIGPTGPTDAAVLLCLPGALISQSGPGGCVHPDQALAMPWTVTCPDCVDRLPLLDLLMLLKAVA